MSNGGSNVVMAALREEYSTDVDRTEPDSPDVDRAPRWVRPECVGHRDRDGAQARRAPNGAARGSPSPNNPLLAVEGTNHTYDTFEETPTSVLSAYRATQERKFGHVAGTFGSDGWAARGGELLHR